MTKSVEESLQRLGMDRIDILHVHAPDDHGDEALSGAFKALDRLRSDGTIGAVGAGMNQAELLARFALEADVDCFLLAGRYALLDQAAALQFPFAHPALTAVPTSAETPAELDENAANMQPPIPTDLWTALKQSGLLHPEAPTPS